MPATNKTAPKAKQVRETAKESVKEFSGIVKENYLNGIDFTFSLWEQNLKAINSHVTQVLDLEKEFVSNVNEYYKDFPKDLPFANGKAVNISDQLDKYIEFGKEQAETAKNASEKLTKDVRTQTEANVEKAFAILGDYLNLIKI